MSRIYEAVTAGFALLLGLSAETRANLIVNGGFEDTINITPPDYPSGDPGLAGNGGLGMPDYNIRLSGWSSPDVSYVNGTGYNFVFSFPTADTLGSPGYNGYIGLYGPGNGFNNGLVASPDGGKFVGADGDTRYHGPLQQTITGLAPGGTYT